MADYMQKCYKIEHSKKLLQVKSLAFYQSSLLYILIRQLSTDTTAALASWKAINHAGITVVNNTSPVSAALPNSLRLDVPINASGPVGVENLGFFGVRRCTIMLLFMTLPF